MRVGLLLALLVGYCASRASAQTSFYEVKGGYAVAFLGDVDHDGIDDFVVGSELESRVTVYSGRTAIPLLKLATGNDLLGVSVAGTGDLDGDAVPDFIAGTGIPAHATVYSGSDGHVLFSVPGSGPRDDVAVAAGGDVDGDGVIDVVAGFRWEQTVRVASGRTGQKIFTFIDLIPYRQFGAAVAIVGDLNGDGHAEIAVGAPNEVNPGRFKGAGSVTVFSGADGTILDKHLGDDFFQRLGSSIAAVGDLDGDQVPDYVAGAPYPEFSSSVPLVRVFSGRTGSKIRDIHDIPESDFGWSVSTAGDFDGDGVGDLVVGAPALEYGGTTNGRASVFSGRDGRLLKEFVGGLQFGRAVAGGGHLDPDGVADVLAGNGLQTPYATRACSGRDYPSQSSNYGAGWPGTLGVPVIGVTGTPAICTSSILSLRNSRGETTVALLMIGFQQDSAPTGWDGTRLVAPAMSVLLSLSTSGLDLLLDVPCDTLLCGTTLFLQGIELDPGASKLVSFTAGLQVAIGGR